MGILDKIKKILPKRKPPEPQNNVPKEKIIPVLGTHVFN